jgi:hypothetical protein
LSPTRAVTQPTPFPTIYTTEKGVVMSSVLMNRDNGFDIKRIVDGETTYVDELGFTNFGMRAVTNLKIVEVVKFCLWI